MNPATDPVIYPSDLVLSALKIQPDGAPSPVESVCLCCGKPIHVGDLYAPFGDKPSFMDDLSLASRGSTVTCGACAMVLTGDVMGQIKRHVFTSDGQVLEIGKWDECAAFLRDPPEPPFVAVYSTGTMAMHLAWRAPVTLSRDLLMVRVGQREIRIRRPVLLAAEKAARELALYLGYEDGKVGGKSGPALNPFVDRTTTFDSFEFSRFRAGREKESPRSVADADLPQEMRFLRDLSLGELWGLVFLLNRP